MDAPPAILVIEQNHGHSLLIEEKIQNSYPWADIHHAHSLQEASSLLPTKKWDLILLNAQLPDGLCTDFIEELSTTQPFAAVAVLTEEITENILNSSHHRGTMEFLVKDRQTLDSLCTRVKRLLSANDRLKRLLEQTGGLESTSTPFQDPLTHTYNRNYFEDALKREVSRANRYENDFSLLIADVDGLSRINEAAGHESGNHCLKALAEILTGAIRSGDLVARYEGDRFVMLLPHCNKKDAIRCASRVLKKVRAEKGDSAFTVSIGVLHYKGSPKVNRPETVMAQAKGALIWAKSHGGNRYHVAA